MCGGRWVEEWSRWWRSCPKCTAAKERAVGVEGERHHRPGRGALVENSVFILEDLCFLGPERNGKAGGSENIRKAINEKYCRVVKGLDAWADTYSDVFCVRERNRQRGNRCGRRGSKNELTREYDDTATVAETALLSGNSDQR